MPKKSSPRAHVADIDRHAAYAERVGFCVWWARYAVGLDGSTKVSLALGKPDNAISKWMKKQPEFDQSRQLADLIGVSPSWLHDPHLEGANAPSLFDGWVSAHRRAAAALQPVSERLKRAGRAANAAKSKRGAKAG